RGRPVRPVGLRTARGRRPAGSERAVRSAARAPARLDELRELGIGEHPDAIAARELRGFLRDVAVRDENGVVGVAFLPEGLEFSQGLEAELGALPAPGRDDRGAAGLRGVEVGAAVDA